jgi:membrane associated rhomboid family serine protease
LDFSEAPATYAIIAATVLVSLYAFTAGPRFIDEFSMRVGAVTRTRGQHRLLTSALLHAGPFHLIFNMLSFWSFGPAIENILGTDGMIVLYVGSALAGSLMILLNNRRNPNYAAIGASGAVSGVILAFCLFYPFHNLYLLGLPWGIPAVLFAPLYLLISTHLMRTPDRVISHEGHLGGALGGLVLTLLMKPEAVTRFF